MQVEGGVGRKRQKMATSQLSDNDVDVVVAVDVVDVVEVVVDVDVVVAVDVVNVG